MPRRRLKDPTPAVVHLLAARDVQDAIKHCFVAVPRWGCKSAVSAAYAPAWKPTLSHAWNRGFWETAWSWAKRGMDENLLQGGFQMDTLAWPGTGAETTSRLMVGKCSLFSCSLFPSPYPNPWCRAIKTSFLHCPCKALFFFSFLYRSKKWRGTFPVPELYTSLLNHPQTSFTRLSLRKYLLQKSLGRLHQQMTLNKAPAAPRRFFYDQLKLFVKMVNTSQKLMVSPKHRLPAAAGTTPHPG